MLPKHVVVAPQDSHQKDSNSASVQLTQKKKNTNPKPGEVAGEIMVHFLSLHLLCESAIYNVTCWNLFPSYLNLHA